MDVRQNLGSTCSDNSFLKTQLCQLGSNLNIGHLNCTSLNLKPGSSKWSEIKRLLDGKFLKVFAISETWLSEIVSDNVINIPGYVLHRSDRSGMRGGGVALYISSDIKHRIVYKSDGYGVVEFLLAELCFGDGRILVGVVYLPHGDFASFEDRVSDILVRYDNVVLVGDFNNNLFEYGKSALVRGSCSRMGLSPIHNSMPTYFDIRCNSVSLLDYFLVSSPDLVDRSDQFQCPGITRHSLIFLSLKICIPVISQFYEFYDYKACNIESFRTLLGQCNFDDMYMTGNVNEQVDILNENLSFLHAAVPLRRRRIRSVREDWINAPEIIHQISVRDCAYRAYVSNRTCDNWRIFCRLRNRVKTVIRKFKRRAHGLLFENKSSRQIWGILGRRGVGRSVADLQSFHPDELNRAFSMNQSDFTGGPVDFTGIPSAGFSFRSVDMSEMLIAFNMIKSGAIGYDRFAVDFIRLLMPIAGCYILRLVNTILTTSDFPSLWKVGKIVPIGKGSKVFDINDLRPITILPILSKMVEHLIKTQLVAHIDDMGLLHDCQSGFRSNRSTTSLLVGLTDNIRKTVSGKGVCVLLSLDLSKAFDRVDHSLLVSKLHRFFGLSKSACKLMYSYLQDRKQYVVSGSCSSGLLPVFSGVPQGSVIGPLLFVMFVNDLFSTVSNNMCQSFAYADDVQLLFKGCADFSDVMQNMITYTVDLLCNWMLDNSLSINVSKTKAMLFGDSGGNCFSIVMDNRNIQFVDRIKCLGLIIDSKLSFDSHIDSVVSRVCFTLRKLYSLDLLLPLDIRKRVVFGLIMPLFLYGLEVYCGTWGYLFRKIRLAFNRAVRYIYSLRVRHSVSPFVRRFLGLSFDDFVKFRSLLHFYKSFKLQVPLYVVDLFKFGRSIRNRQIMIPAITPILERSFCVRVARVFNNLPSSLRVFDYSVDVFKKKLLQEFSSN